MKIGLTLPSFSSDPGPVLARAREAEAAGIDGVFLFDHLWPMGSPARPALSLFPLAGAVLAATTTIRLGTLVARVGLLPDEVVLASLAGLAEMSGGRLIAAVGTGDAASSEENRRLGIPYASAAARRERLRKVVGELAASGLETWVGGGGRETNAIARELGCTLNLWGAPAEAVRAEGADGTPVSWGGPLPKEGRAAGELRALEEAGATWAVWGWPRSVELVTETAAAARIGPGAGSR